MAITPQTNLKLLKCNLNLDEANQLNFASAEAQFTYFNSLTKIETNNFSYQRKDNVIRYPAHIDSIIEYNYCMYQNSNYTDKWFYAYIVRMEYVNDGMTNIYIKTDPWQSWQFDITFMRSFVEREHVNVDTIGLHTLDEPVGTGEFISNDYGIIDTMGQAQSIVIGVSKLLVGMTYWETRLYSGTYSGLYLYTFESTTGTTAIQHASHFIRAYDKAGYGQDIVTMYMVPSNMITSVEYYSNVSYDEGGTQVTLHYGLIKGVLASYSSLETISINNTIDGYTPKNNKLFVAPFNYLYLSNNVGSDVIYHYEDFKNNTPKFAVEGVISIGCSTRVYPLDYKKEDDDMTITIPRPSYMYGITAGKLPTCSWINDSFTNWMTQNSINIGTQVVTSATMGSVSAFTGNGMGALSGLAETVNAIDSIRRADMIPNSVGGNVSGGDVAFATRNMNVIYHKMSVRNEVAKVIDDFFSTYGYKVNDNKVPNITGRRNWNFVKTIKANIEGYIPQEDLQEIKNMFNTGITIWHNPSTFLDYSQNNDII